MLNISKETVADVKIYKESFIYHKSFEQFNQRNLVNCLSIWRKLPEAILEWKASIQYKRKIKTLLKLILSSISG